MAEHSIEVENGTTCKNIADLMSHDWNYLWSVQTVFYILYSVVFLLALVSNLLILTAVFSRTKLRTTRNIFVANLACADAMMVVFCLPLSAYALFEKVWVFGVVLCHAMPFMQAFTVVISATSLSVLALDRYFLIVKPFGLKPIESRYAIYILPSMWFTAAVFCSPIGVFQTVKRGDMLSYPTPLCHQFCFEEFPTKQASHVYFVCLLTLQYILPLLITSFCYTCVSRTAIKSSNTARRGSVSAERQASAAKRIKRMNRILTTVVITYALCWLPQNAINVLRDLDQLPEFVREQEYFYSLLCHYCSMLPTVSNPILYLACNEEFRSHALRTRSPSTPSINDTESKYLAISMKTDSTPITSTSKRSRSKLSAASSITSYEVQLDNGGKRIVEFFKTPTIAADGDLQL